MDLNSYIDEIKEKVDIVDYISRFIELKKSGRNYVGLCPFHSEKTPSFTVSREKGIFYCFGCKTGGNILEFVKKFENLSFKEAVEELCKYSDIQTPEWKEVKVSTEEDEYLYKINEEVAIFFNNSLRENEKALSYLNERGINDIIIDNFSIGYAPAESNKLILFLKNKNINSESCLKIGILSKNLHGEIYSYFRNRIIFPIFDTRNRIIGFGGRILNKNEEPKYLNSPENLLFRKGKNLYGLNISKNEINKTKAVIIVEGYIDFISLYRNSIKNVAATLGTAFTMDQMRILKRYTDTLYLCFDNDEAGRIATKRAIDFLLPNEVNCKVISIPNPYKDPDEFIDKFKEEGFNKLINESTNSFNFIWNEIKKGKNIKDPVDLANIVTEIFTKIIKIKNNVLVESYLKIISTETGISLRSLNDELTKLKKTFQGKLKDISKSSNITRERERLILKALITMSEDYVQLIFEKISIDDFNSNNEKELFVKLSEIYQNNGYLNYYGLYNLLDDNSKHFLSELIMLDDSFINEQSILQTLNKIEREKKLKYLKTNLTYRISEAEKLGDIELFRRLSEEVKKIVKETNN